MDKRDIAKKIAEIAITTAAAAVITKTLSSAVPATQKFKTAEMTGSLGGWMIGSKLQPHVDKLIDDYFDKRDTKKN